LLFEQVFSLLIVSDAPIRDGFRQHLFSVFSYTTAITFHKEKLTFTGDKDNAMNKMLLTMLGAVSAFELWR